MERNPDSNIYDRNISTNRLEKLVGKKKKVIALGTITLGLVFRAWKWIVKKHHEGLEELGLREKENSK